MKEKNRTPIEKYRKKLPQFTTMNVIDGQAGLVICSSLIFYSLTIDNILNIVVLLILAATSIAMLTGDDGIITNAQNLKISTELSEYKEQLELYISNKKIENTEFNKETLFAGKDTLRYNTQKEGETGTIKTICPEMKSNYAEKIQIKKGKMILDTKDKREIKIAVGLGIEVNPYEIKDGELIASEDNLLLIDSNGTLKLPESVTSIGEGAFANTAPDGIQLKKVIIPSTVREIKANVFNGNTTIEEVVIETKNGKGVTTIGDYEFNGCKNLKTIELSDTVTTIGQCIFRSCENLINVKLSKNLTEISYEMFRNCGKLEEIKIPEGVRKIGAGAFSYCFKLKRIEIPSTLENIAENFLQNNPTIEIIGIDKNKNFILENGILMDKDRTEMKYIGQSAIEGDTFRAPNGIIKLSITIDYEQIRKVIIPASVAYIGSDVFTKNVETIEIDVDNSNYIVNNNKIYNKEKTILYKCFSKEKEITIEEGVLPTSVKIIEHSVFAGKRTLKNIVIPETVEKIGGDVFTSCVGLTKIEIPSSVTSIGGNCFGECNNLKEIIIHKPKGSISGSPWGSVYGERAIIWDN